MNGGSGPAALVEALSARLAPLEAAANAAWWDANLHADDVTSERRARADLAHAEALADPEAFGAIRAARTRPDHDPTVRRALDLLHDQCWPHQGSSSVRREIVERQVAVEAAFASHRGRIDDVPVDDQAIQRVLRTADDVARRQAAWEASKSVGPVVADQVRELARQRNRLARDLGVRDHFALVLGSSEMSERRLLATLAEVDRRTRAPFAAWKAAHDDRLADRFGVVPADLRPWHYDDPFFQDPPVSARLDLDPWFEGRDPVGMARATFSGLGIDVDAILDRSDLAPRPGKNQHAFCIDVDRAGDVRVLANVVDDERSAETMLHELGHGVSFTGLDPAAAWSFRTLHPIVTEGIAMLFGRLTRDPDWLRGPARVDTDEIASRRPELAGTARAGLLVLARWVLVMTEFERRLYSDPDDDLDRVWWDLVERFQLLRRPPGRRTPDWAAKIHVAVAPVYYQNYLYGEMVASQLSAVLRRETGGIVDRPAAGRLLTERVARPGTGLRWDALIAEATGAPLSPAALVADLAVGEG